MQDRKNIGTGKIHEYDWNACENKGILLEGVFGFVLEKT